MRLILAKARALHPSIDVTLELISSDGEYSIRYTYIDKPQGFRKVTLRRLWASGSRVTSAKQGKAIFAAEMRNMGATYA